MAVIIKLNLFSARLTSVFKARYRRSVLYSYATERGAVDLLSVRAGARHRAENNCGAGDSSEM